MSRNVSYIVSGGDSFFLWTSLGVAQQLLYVCREEFHRKFLCTGL